MTKKYEHKRGNFNCKHCDFRTDRLQHMGLHLRKAHKIPKEENKGHYISVLLPTTAIHNIDIEKVEATLTPATTEPIKQIPISDTILTQYDIELVELALPSIMKMCHTLEKFKGLLKKG